MSWREKHAELLRENNRLKEELEAQEDRTMSYIYKLEESGVAYYELLKDIKELDEALTRREKLHEIYKDEMWVQYVEACETEYALERSRILCKRLEWFIRGNPPKDDKVAQRRYNEIIAVINEQSSN